MKADLHVHSHFSDGYDSVMQVLQQAQKNGVTHISFVDHDFVSHLPTIQTLGEQFEITIIPGVEISAYDYKRKRKVHVLGYHFQQDAMHIKEIGQLVLARRQAHSFWQIEQIQKAGYYLDRQAVQDQAQPSCTIYKQHIMKLLTKASYTSLEYKELYKKLFKGNGVASGDIEYVDAFDAVKAIVKDGGIAVVAHPGQLDSFDIIPDLVEIGLAGVEYHHPNHTKEDHERILLLAKKHNLMLTGGSDYHGAFGESSHVGAYISPFNDLLANV